MTVARHWIEGRSAGCHAIASVSAVASILMATCFAQPVSGQTEMAPVYSIHDPQLSEEITKQSSPSFDNLDVASPSNSSDTFDDAFLDCSCTGECDSCTSEDDDEQHKSYGPCRNKARGTLFQWSYGTSFSGGPGREEPLVTDRPDFTEAASTVGLGVAQLEFGYTYHEDDDGTTTTRAHSYPESLLRYGMLDDWLEFRIAVNIATEQVGGNETVGGEDLYLGFKIGLTPQEGFLPEMALIPQMTVPTGSTEFTAHQTLPGLNWIYGWELSDNVSTAGSTQFNRAIDDLSERAYTEWAQSWTFAFTLTEKLGAYTEWYAFFPHSSETAKTEHYFNGGFTYLFSNDVQWDIRAGWGLNDAAEDLLVGTGLSIRFR